MTKAYVLINTDPDVEDEFIQEVMNMEGVIEVASVYGRYDFVVILSLVHI